jgi:hypothetical protein
MKNIMKSIRRAGAASALTIALQIAVPAVSSAQSKTVTRAPQPPARTTSAPPRTSPPETHSSPTPSREPAHVNSAPSHTQSAPSSSSSTPSREPAHVSPAPSHAQSVPSSHTAAPAVRENGHPAPAGRTSSPAVASHPSPVARPAVARHIETRRADGSRVVMASPHRGYVERSVRPGFVARTYVVGGRSYARVYRSYSFRGVVYHRYVPAFYFHPGFYSWVYNPWAGPVVFSWDFYSSPWYGYYGPYFAPSPVYNSPSLWLTDYLISENLKAAYEARQQAAGGQTAAITPEIKELISQQVRQELAAERKAAENDKSGEVDTAQTATPVALDPTQRVFVVSTSLSVPGDNDQTCALTPGDIILRSSTQTGDENNIAVTVLSSKGGNCPAGSNTTVDSATLQEMHNDFRQHIDSGLAVLAQNQGKGGLPTGPAANPTLTRDGQAAPDLDAASAVTSLQQSAAKNP